MYAKIIAKKYAANNNAYKFYSSHPYQWPFFFLEMFFSPFLLPCLVKLDKRITSVISGYKNEHISIYANIIAKKYAKRNAHKFFCS